MLLLKNLQVSDNFSYNLLKLSNLYHSICFSFSTISPVLQSGDRMDNRHPTFALSLNLLLDGLSTFSLFFLRYFTSFSVSTQSSILFTILFSSPPLSMKELRTNRSMAPISYGGIANNIVFIVIKLKASLFICISVHVFIAVIRSSTK